jgi:flagellar assembly protein FliH
MSSRVLKYGSETAPGPIVWRQVESLPGDSASVWRPPAPTRSAGLETERQSLATEAYQRGYREGEAAGKSATQPVLERLAHSIDLVAGLGPRLRKEAEGDLLRLSIVIARRILHRELSVDPEAISGLIMAALEKLKGHEIQRVRVHPDIESAMRVSLDHFAVARSVPVVADRSRQPGDVVFETERGSLDASVETQLEEIGRGLADRLRSRS